MKTCLSTIGLCLCFAVLLFSSCLKETQSEQDQNKIEEYIDEMGLVTEVTESGLHYIIEEEGTGAMPNANSQVTVAYKGYFLDGTVFDESPTNEPITFYLTGVINGWQEGLQKFREGGSGMLIIPSKLGYGSQQYGSIPGKSVLVFDIELLEVN